MNLRALLIAVMALTGGATFAFAAPPASIPPALARNVDYRTEVQPILGRCAGCHLNGNRQGGFQLDTRESVLKGGQSGPAVVVGNSAGSHLIKLVSGFEPGNVMPLGGAKLTPAQIGVLRSWIDHGLTFPPPLTGVKSTTPSASSIFPRHPVLPPAPPGTNPIDRLLLHYFHAHKIVPGPLVSDRVYARRVYLDLIGLLPSPAELAAFEADRRPDKRGLLAKKLLANNREYAIHWMSFWNDCLRNDYVGTGYIDGGRKQITRWLYQALATNMPYNQFVSELVNPTPGSEGFINGIVWRGIVNASQTPQMQAAQNISQVFLGINLKCASCHDSFISNWKLVDSYGMAGIYADAPLETVRCDRPTGTIAPVRFLYPQLGAIDAHAPRRQRMAQLAAALTSPKDGRLTRTIVNRIWQRLMGRGLVEPADEMDNPPWDADLLDWLASDLSGNGFDLKKTLYRIVTSRAYQLPAMGEASARDPHFVFRGPTVRRMTAEQFADSVSTLTGVWPHSSAAKLGDSTTPLTAKWIWKDAAAASAAPGERIYLRKSFLLAARPAHAPAVMTCDNEFTLYVNGQKIAASDNWQKPLSIDLAPQLREGLNTLAVEAINWPDPVTGKGKDVASGPNPAGFFFDAHIDAARVDSAKPEEIGSDSSWLCASAVTPGWEQTEASVTGWKQVAELGGANAAPWADEQMLSAAMPRPGSDGHVRAALVVADPLTTALGRPNRDQVVTDRSSAATTLQALELMNGRTLALRLQKGAKRWIAASGSSNRKLINGIFLQALGRAPTPAEMQACAAEVGSPPTQDGVTDLLWTITMLPEYQLIY